MNLENLDILIDKNLTLLNQKDEHSEYYENLLNEEGKQFWSIGKQNQAIRLTQIMLDKNLIVKQNELVILTELGLEVVKKGGWITYVKAIKMKKIAQEKSKQEHEKIDLKLKKWQSKTFWVIFIIAIIGSFLSVFNTIENYKSTNKIDTDIQSLKSEITKIKKFLEVKKIDTSKIKQTILPKKIDTTKLK